MLHRGQRKVRFSATELLERVQIRSKRVSWAVLLQDFPGLSTGVLYRNLAALRASGLILSRHQPAPPGMLSSGKTYYRMTPRGSELLSCLMPYRDWWEMIELREVRNLAKTIKTLGRLEKVRRQLFPGPGAQRYPLSYWHRTSERITRT